MHRVTAEEVDAIYAEFIADRDGMAGQFWPAVQAYAAWCLFKVPEWLREDLVADVVVAAMMGIGTLKLKVTFAKWFNGLIFNMRAERYRVEKYGCIEVPYSQLAAEREDGTFLEYQPTDASCPLDASDLITDEGRARTATTRLDALRAGFKKQEDIDLFDLLRSGKTLTEAAKQFGQSYSTVQRRFSRWKNKHGQKSV